MSYHHYKGTPLFQVARKPVHLFMLTLLYHGIPIFTIIRRIPTFTISATLYMAVMRGMPGNGGTNISAQSIIGAVE